MIDNLHLIKPLLDFSKPGDFYQLYVFKRKKDQPAGERENHQSVRTVKSYSIESLEYLDRRWEEITTLCEIFKARAYIQVQKQNHRDVSLAMMEALAGRIRAGVHNQTGLFDSVVGQLKTLEKRWIVDIDNKDEAFDREVQEFINTRCRPYGMKIVANIPTKSGHHLITERFDVMEFKGRYPEIDIQKKGPTCCYVPSSLM